MLDLNSYISDIEQKISMINREANEIKIVNAGFMNGGKSSLFNALLNQQIFAVADRRCTRKAKQAKFFSDDVYLVDTPGLAADEEDDKNAYDVYKKADLLVFVHGLKAAAELRKEEISQIKQIIKVFPSEDSFWKRFYMVLTYSDEYEDKDERDKIENNIRSTSQKYLSYSDFPIFFISNIYYEFWLNDKNEDDLAKSGITDLHKALQEQIYNCQVDKKDLTYQRLNALLRKAKKELNNERQNAECILQAKQRQIEKQRSEALERMNLYFASIDKIKTVLKELKKELKNLQIPMDEILFSVINNIYRN